MNSDVGIPEANTPDGFTADQALAYLLAAREASVAGHGSLRDLIDDGC
jgi:hypothetical protein